MKPWRHQELTSLPPFGNISDVEHDNEALVIDKYYDCVSDLVREGDVFAAIALVYNLEKSALLLIEIH